MMHTKHFLESIVDASLSLDAERVEKLTDQLVKLRADRGRLFILGVGGSAGNAGHAVNDFRKLCNIETYAPTDNVSELTARANDEGWASVFSGWLKVSQLCDKDALLIFSVGGGDAERNVSVNIIEAIKLAKTCGAAVYGVVGRDQGYTARNADLTIIIPQISASLTTPISEVFQSVIWHCLVSNPKLQVRPTKW
ncbi:SIS domain-containing protein [Alphaproteobacteria bacterium]|nr:SIS domain-containing protein [Alphaproteobacteria bacterium]